MALPVVENVLSKEMDRKQFLTHVGAGLLAVVGISGIIKTLGDNKPAHSGYGASVYGGSTDIKKK